MEKVLMDVKIVAKTVSCVEGVDTIEEFVAYAARVSNPGNQINNETTERLLKYLARNNHWSPFEMVNFTMEVKTTRDIARQILRHRSFAFQEFSQRYAEVDTDLFETREARLQDHKNRQNSIEFDDEYLKDDWETIQEGVKVEVARAYVWALEHGIAKEQARVVLPEGMTPSTMYMQGSLRSWIHYCLLRMANGTQKEHREVALAAWDLITKEIPSLKNILEQ
jgi:thymidylate synthase (FAD)